MLDFKKSLDMYPLWDLYEHVVGDTEVPLPWHEWCMYGVLSAVCSDKVYVQKDHWRKLMPNLYVFLIGPSGCGKGKALNFAQQFVPPSINKKVGTVTYKALIDYIAQIENGVDKTRMLLVHDELSNSIGKQSLADDFVKQMTDWFDYREGESEDSTRTHGTKGFRHPVITWMAGSTTEWLAECVSLNAMQSGFFGRVTIAPGEYDYKVRVAFPPIPEGYEEVCEEICRRINYFNSSLWRGRFELTAGGQLEFENWYNTRDEPPEGSGLHPFWQRQPTLAFKLGMLLSMCDVDFSKKVITAQNMVDAIALTEASKSMLPSIFVSAVDTQDKRDERTIRALIRERGRIRHKLLAQKAYKRGINAAKLRLIIDQLVEEDRIHIHRLMRTREYIWGPDPDLS